MSEVVIRVENISKLYRLGEVGTGSLAHDVNRWWHKVRGKEDPYLKIGEVNDRTKSVSGSKKTNLTTEDTESTEGTAGLRLAGQAGAEFPNPSTSELARDSEIHRPLCYANGPALSLRAEIVGRKDRVALGFQAGMCCEKASASSA